MIEKALTGSKRYWGWIGSLIGVSGIGLIFYLAQWFSGSEMTGMSRDVSWGLSIANYTFLVGVAASAVMVVLPYYLHDYKAFGAVTALGEFLAVVAIAMSILFIFVDLGQPFRAFNILFYPTPNSPFFWNMVILPAYLLFNLVIGWAMLDADSKSVPPPFWVKPLIYISIPWGISIHTVTAFVYAGLAARPFWNTAILAPRFLVSAFASGPSLLILMCMIIKRFTSFDPGEKAIQKLVTIIAYSMILNLFFIILEIFSSFYSSIPSHRVGLEYLFFGLEGHTKLVPLTWISLVFAMAGTLLLVTPYARRTDSLLSAALVMVFFSLWIDKGLCLVVTGFIPSPFERITEYSPSLFEGVIAVGIWAVGFLILSVLYKIAISIKEELIT